MRAKVSNNKKVLIISHIFCMKLPDKYVHNFLIFLIYNKTILLSPSYTYLAHSYPTRLYQQMMFGHLGCYPEAFRSYLYIPDRVVIDQFFKDVFFRLGNKRNIFKRGVTPTYSKEVFMALCVFGLFKRRWYVEV